MSIDFEDWFQPFSYRSIRGWDAHPSRVPQDTRRLLSLLRKFGVRCTFFILGEIAEKFPDEVRAIDEAGHEIASHGYRHLPLWEQEPRRFEEETAGSLELLRQLTGRRVVGFRAPFFSLREDSLWAVESLRRLGFQYDSSISPTFSMFPRWRLGRRGRSLPFTFDNGLREFPMTTWPLGKLAALPFSGSLYYRILPYSLVRAGLSWLNARNVPGNVYLHPREIDPDLPRIDPRCFSTALKLKLIVYAGTRTFEAKLERMLKDFTFVPMRELLALE